MKKFRSYISEERSLDLILSQMIHEDTSGELHAPAPGKEINFHKEGKVANNTKGVMHELLVGRHLNGGNHMAQHENIHHESPTEAHNRLKDTVHPNDYKKMDHRAKSAAEHIKSQLPKGHKIVGVYHTSKAGDTEKVTGHKATQKEDSSDIYVSTKHPKTGHVTHHGVSLKVTDKSDHKIPASSLGMGSSGEKAKDHYQAHQRTIVKAHPALKKLTNAGSRKEWQKANPKAAEHIKGENRKLLQKVAKSHAAELNHHLQSGNHEHVVKHIRDVLSAKSTPAESGGHTFIKHTTYHTKDGVQHHTGKPQHEYNHILNDHKNISVKHTSGGTIKFYHKGKAFAQQSHKFNSQSDPLSTIKSAGKSLV